MSVLTVEDGRGDGQEPVQADGHQVEDGGGGADDVTGQVEVTDGVGEAPTTPVSLKEIQERKFLPCCSYLQLRTYYKLKLKSSSCSTASCNELL